MYCSKCGSKLEEKAKYCSYCGIKVVINTDNILKETPNTANLKNQQTSDNKSAEANTIDTNILSKEQFSEDKLSFNSFGEKICKLWKSLDLFSKVMTICIGICVFACLFAFLFCKYLSCFISLVQISLLIAIWLIQKQIVKVNNRNVNIILAVMALLLIMPYLGSYKLSTNNKGEDKKNSAGVVATVEDKQSRVLQWPESELAKMLPIPKSNVGYVQNEDIDEISICVENTTREDFNAYINSCTEKGFTIVASKGNDFYNAKNEEGYQLSINYQDKNTMSIIIKDPVYTVQIEIDCTPNIILSKYNVDVYIDSSKIGTLKHGSKETFEVELKTGSYMLKVTKEGDRSVDGTVKVEVSENVKISYNISCHSDQVNVKEKYVESLNPLSENQAKIPKSSEDYKDKIYEEVVEDFKVAGFTNISTQPIRDLTGGWFEKDGEIEKISIAGKTEFKKAEILDKDIKIVISYHTLIESKSELSTKETSAPVTFAVTNSMQEVTEKPDGILNVNNSPELAALIHMNRRNDKESIKAFTNKYNGREIEIELLTAFVENNGNYKTRFDYLLYAIDGNQAMLSGPAFFFENVNYYDLHLVGDNVPSSFGIGIHCRVSAKIEGYEDDFVKLKPTSIKVIKVY